MFGAFVQFWCIWDCLVDLQNSVQNGPNWYKSSWYEVASKFFKTNALDPSHWTLNKCFGAFHKIWVHLGPLGGLTKLLAKWDDLVPKFVPQSRVRIFRNERTLSTPLDPKLMFWCVSYHFAPFGTIWLLYQSRSKTKSRRNFSQRTHPIDLIGP